MFLVHSVAWADGAEIYKSQCAKCHGDSGKSDTGPGKAMKIAPIAGNAAIAAMSADDLVKKIKELAKHPTGIKSLSDSDAKAVGEFVKQLASAK